jgi:hypothetical protein
MCKVVDIVRHGNNTLELEIRAYATLQLLQGDVIPRFYVCYNVWGIYGSFLALEPVGYAVTVSSILLVICHGNVARRNFWIRNIRLE